MQLPSLWVFEYGFDCIPRNIVKHHLDLGKGFLDH
jgi:hypothetical protein